MSNIDYIEYVQHERFFEGSATTEPTETQIIDAIKRYAREKNYFFIEIGDIYVSFDDLIKIWRWNAEVIELSDARAEAAQ